MTKANLQQQLKDAMFAKDELKKSVLRMLLSAITYYEINKGGAGYEASEEDVMAVIQNQVKQRKDSIQQFEQAGRQELADKEKQELELLQTYMPAQLGEEEIKKLVEEAITSTGATSQQDMGKVMGALMPKVKGKADGTLVSTIVKESLQ
ncbi:MAG TPA: GatB/YqeY domain-containing protein [Patescibacteria group bacterium]|nr:GatB/YqeY domain-containing protein [Patescibacteria group bacterium]